MNPTAPGNVLHTDFAGAVVILEEINPQRQDIDIKTYKHILNDYHDYEGFLSLFGEGNIFWISALYNLCATSKEGNQWVYRLLTHEHPLTIKGNLATVSLRYILPEECLKRAILETQYNIHQPYATRANSQFIKL